MTLRGQNQGHIFGVKCAKNDKNSDVGPIGFTLDDLEKLKVKVDHKRPSDGDRFWGYTPVRITGLLVTIYFSSAFF